MTPDNKVSYTESMPAQSSAWTVQWRIHHDCHQMYEKITVWEENWDYGYRTNGARFRIRFQGYNANPGQYEIVDTDLNELKGDPEAPLTFIKETIK